jgi:hypothetical protein
VSAWGKFVELQLIESPVTTIDPSSTPQSIS